MPENEVVGFSAVLHDSWCKTALADGCYYVRKSIIGRYSRAGRSSDRMGARCRSTPSLRMHAGFADRGNDVASEVRLEGGGLL